ncbi:response regulator [Chloroflexota bacterium]
MAKKILVVEDNPTNMKLLLAALRPQGYDLIQATDGEEALKTAISKSPELIIMDVQLPKMNGMEVTGKLREMPEFSDVPIIAVTAYAMKVDKEKALESGCNAYLSKPINIQELRNVVAEMLLLQR